MLHTWYDGFIIYDFAATVEPLITDIPNSGHLLVTDKTPCPRSVR